MRWTRGLRGTRRGGQLDTHTARFPVAGTAPPGLLREAAQRSRAPLMVPHRDYRGRGSKRHGRSPKPPADRRQIRTDGWTKENQHTADHTPRALAYNQGPLRGEPLATGDPGRSTSWSALGPRGKVVPYSAEGVYLRHCFSRLGGPPNVAVPNIGAVGNTQGLETLVVKGPPVAMRLTAHIWTSRVGTLSAIETPSKCNRCAKSPCGAARAWVGGGPLPGPCGRSGQNPNLAKPLY